MTSTKTRTSLWAANALTAGAADETTAIQNVATGFGVQVSIKLTNGATGPTVPAQCQIETYADSAGTLAVKFGGPLVGSVTNNGVSSWSVQLPIGVAGFRLVAGSNTAQDVTIDADYANVTAIA